MINITKWVKKQKLLDKYRRTPEKMNEDLFILRHLRGECETKYIHKIHCELRCYNRLKKL
jgi:hypothetical protein